MTFLDCASWFPLDTEVFEIISKFPVKKGRELTICTKNCGSYSLVEPVLMIFINMLN